MNIPRFMPGQALSAVHLNQLSDAIRTSRVTSFVGGRVQMTTGGTMLIADPSPSGGGGVATAVYPFQISQIDTSGGRPVLATNSESYLIKDQTDKDFVSISPINVEGAYAGYFLPDVPGVICVTVEFDTNMEITNAFQESIGIAAWPDYPNPIERDTEATGADYLRQKKLRIAIAEVAFDTDKREGTVYNDNGTSKKLIPITTSNLMLEWQVLQGMAALLAIPFPKGHCWLTIPTP